MYKKIKNSSFMNLIWFIICILPLCFILFSLNNEDNKTKVYSNNTSFFAYSGYEFPITELYENSDYLQLLYSTNEDNEAVFRINDLVGTYEVNITFEPNEQKLYYCYLILEFENELSVIDTTIDYNSMGTTWETYYTNEYENTNIVLMKFRIEVLEQYISGDLFYRLILDLPSNELIRYSKVKMYFYSITEDISEEYFINKPKELIIQPLNYWFNNFKSNGFISSAFLNLAQLFGVTNVYYSLACYYIEYLLIIVLLHLAFDVLYMLPNICHKFMEKIGGERD